MLLRTLGRLELEGSELTRPKPLLLLAYLAMEGPRGRRFLADLFWNEGADGRKSLGVALSQIRRGAPGAVAVDGPRLRASVDVDAFRFIDRVELGDSTGSLELYGGPFLEGVQVPQIGEELEDWIYATRERLARRACEALAALGEQEAAMGDFAAAARRAEQALDLPGADPYEPVLLRRLHRLLVAGDHPRGREVAGEAADLGVELHPSRESARSALSELNVERPAARLPRYATPFIGRAAEVERLRSLVVDDPDARLVSLVGVGGMGKTRLAVELAARVRDAFSDGVYFVPLECTETRHGIVESVAVAVGLRFHGESAAERQLLEWLARRRMLLVLDNVEHLTEHASLLSDLIAAAPSTKLLVTSRVSLRLRDEWLVRVDGLAENDGVRTHGQASKSSAMDAVELFATFARRSGAEFDIEVERERVARICRRVGGSPLAIELAATWLRVLSLEDIEHELDRGLGLLETHQADVPDRHRSLRRVMEASWQLLDAEEQGALEAMSVFRGAFRSEDARAVSGASRGVLAQLADGSLLRAEAPGRYRLHELVRQYAAERLGADSESEHRALRRHGEHFLAVLADASAGLAGTGQVETLRRTASILANIEAAWRWAVRQDDHALLGRALAGCFSLFVIMGRLRAGAELIDELVASLAAAPHARTEEPDSLRARAWVRQGAFAYLLGDNASAERIVERALAHGLTPQHSRDLAFAHLVLGSVAADQGQRAKADARLQRAHVLAEAVGDATIEADALHELAHLCTTHGDYERGRELAYRSLAASERLGRPDWIAYALDTLGWALACLGEYEDATARFAQAKEIFETLGNRLGAARMHANLGSIAWARGEHDVAAEALEAGLSVAREHGARMIVVSLLGDLALVEVERGSHAHASQLAREGLELATDLGSILHVAYHHVGMGAAAARGGDEATARRHFLEALRSTHSPDLEPQCLMTLYYLAWTAMPDAARHGVIQAESSAVRTWLSIVADHPKSRALFRERARRQLTAMGPVSGVDESPEALEATASLGSVIDGLLRAGNGADRPSA